MHIRLRTITIALCIIFVVDTQVSAHEENDDVIFLLQTDKMTKASCPRIVKLLDKPGIKFRGFQKTLIAAQAAYWTLYLDCPTKYSNLPIEILHTFPRPILEDDAGVTLGPVYEYGVRVEPDLDEARYWYRRAAFSLLSDREEYWDKMWLRAVRINPKVRDLTEEEFQTAWDAGELKSPIFEEEIAAVRKLLSGPVEDIITASEHLYRGTNGYPRNKEAAQEILEIAVRRGAPEAQYALARGIIERRFQTLNFNRDTQWEEAMRYMTRAAGQHYLPAVLRLAKFCENDDSIISALSAMALYQIAANKGAQGAEASLRQLRSKWAPVREKWIDEEIQYIEAGITRPCRVNR